MTQKVMLHFIVIILTSEMQWCYRWCQWHHVMLMHISIILTQGMQWCHWWQISTSCNAWTGANCATWPKSHVAPHSSCLDLRNVAMLPLMILMVAWMKSHDQKFMLHFISFILTQCSGASHNAVSITRCKCLHQWCHMTKNPYCTSFWLSWPKECSSAIDDAISVTWCWLQCQWHHITRSHVALHFNHLELRNVMVSLTIPSVSHDTKANGVTWWKNPCCTSLHWNGAIIHAVSIIWPWCQHQWCHMTKIFILQLISVVLTQGIGQNCDIWLPFDDFRNAVVPLTILSVSHDSDASGIT